MNEEKTIRKRFYKPYHFLANAGRLDLGCLTEIFKNFHLDDFREEINFWLQLALSNNQSAYEDGCDREDLIGFVEELQKLIEAFHFINNKINHQEKKRQLKGLSKKTRKILSKMNIPASLTEEDKARPGLVIKRFCKTFKQAYAKIELLDMLDAVITYEGDKTLYRGNLVLFYQHVHCLIKLAYRIGKNKKFYKIPN
jgi:hypothetical protein